MIINILIAFVLLDCVAACALWFLIDDDLIAGEHQITQAERARDDAIDEWFRTPDSVIVDLSRPSHGFDDVAEAAPSRMVDRPKKHIAGPLAEERL